MTVANASSQYTKVAIILHWLIALLVIGQIAGGLYAAELPREQAELKAALFNWHKSFGLLVLVLTVARIAWRFIHPVPPLPAGMAAWETLVMKATHFAFYALLIAIPMLGWALVSAHPKRSGIEFFGLPWPFLPFGEGAQSREAHEFYAELHEYGAFIMIGLIVLHVAAALKHQFVNRDGLMARMAPMMEKK